MDCRSCVFFLEKRKKRPEQKENNREFVLSPFVQRLRELQCLGRIRKLAGSQQELDVVSEVVNALWVKVHSLSVEPICFSRVLADLPLKDGEIAVEFRALRVML
jgi:hypothetical protein